MPPPVSDTSVPLDAAELGLEPEQAQNAQAIIEVGRSMEGITDRDIQIALMAASQESNLYNIDHGDDWWFQQNGWGETSDSRGLFQQRDSWGTEECRLTPECSAKLFYEALLKVPDRESLSSNDAAQAVQVSAFPDEYAKWEDQAKALLEASSKPSGVLVKDVEDGGTTRSPQGTVKLSYDHPDIEDSAASLKPDGYLEVPAALPYKEMVPGGRVSSLYGNRTRTDPTTGKAYEQFHTGLDIGAPEGTPILAPFDVCIDDADTVDSSGLGIHIVATPQGFDDVRVYFGHNSRNIAKTGECYKAGEVIAEIGNTGNSTGPHLHLQIESKFNGWQVDPSPLWGDLQVEY